MISKDFKRYYIVCDCCDYCSGNGYETWQDAVDAKAEEGFKSKKYKGEDCFNGWVDLCEECQVDK